MEKKGFTIIELLVAIFFVSVGIIGTLIAIQQTGAYIDASFERLTAIYLAQEGIEIVRNIRDTNWIQEDRDSISFSPWDDGICSLIPPLYCEWQSDYTTVTFETTADFEKCIDAGYNCRPYNDNDFLRIDGGFYNYSSGNPTPFKRKITISDKENFYESGALPFNEMKVTVTVSWEANGPHEVKVEEILYNWRE